VLTTDRRRVWAQVREEHLWNGPRPNRESLTAVEESDPRARAGEQPRAGASAQARPRVCSSTVMPVGAGSTSRSSSSWRRTASRASAWSTRGSTGARCFVLPSSSWARRLEGALEATPSRELEPVELRFELTESLRGAIACSEERADALLLKPISKY
jgi:hypothetical protein